MGVTKRLHKINKRIVASMYFVESLLFAALIITVLLNVFCRYILRSPLFWANELACDLLVYLVLLGASLALYFDKHVGLNIKTVHASKGLKVFTDIVEVVCIWAFLIITMIIGIKLFWENRSSLTGTIFIPSGYVYLAAPVSAVIAMPLYLEKCLNKIGNVQ